MCEIVGLESEFLGTSSPGIGLAKAVGDWDLGVEVNCTFESHVVVHAGLFTIKP